MTSAQSLLAEAAAIAISEGVDGWVFANEAMRAFHDASAAQQAAPAAAASILAKISEGALGERFTARDVYKHHWAGLRSRQAVQQGLDHLVARGLLAPHPTDTGGRPRVEYTTRAPA
jgi:hypothetical protein